MSTKTPIVIRIKSPATMNGVTKPLFFINTPLFTALLNLSSFMTSEHHAIKETYARLLSHSKQSYATGQLRTREVQQILFLLPK
ncbi:MAG TPA: hypothetical protein DCE80_17490 [Ignavibacteriales bacterium]|nr:hypothetical protein [Ignavibacteriales bacterium]